MKGKQRQRKEPKKTGFDSARRQSKVHHHNVGRASRVLGQSLGEWFKEHYKESVKGKRIPG